MVETVHAPAHLAWPGSPQAKQLHQPLTQPSLGQNCHQQKKSRGYACRVALVVSDSSQPCRLWPARLFCREGRFSRQEYWNVLANTSCYTFPELYISCFPSCRLPWGHGAARTLQPKQLHHLQAWPSQGQTPVLQGNLRSKPQWTTHMQRWK